LVIGHEHVAIDLVDEHFVDDVLLHVTRLLDQIPKTHTCALIVLLLGVNHVDKRSTVLNLVSLVALDRLVSWEVDNVKLDVFVIGDRLAFNCYSRQQKECLVGRHLLEHNLGYRGFARPECGSVIGKTYLGMPIRYMFIYYFLYK